MSNSIAESAARKIIEDVLGPEHLCPCPGCDGKTDARIASVSATITGAFKSVMEVLHEALKVADKPHDKHCKSNFRWKDLNDTIQIPDCNCWVSRAQKILENHK